LWHHPSLLFWCHHRLSWAWHFPVMTAINMAPMRFLLYPLLWPPTWVFIASSSLRCYNYKSRVKPVLVLSAMTSHLLPLFK
jgi:hypothetical protein